VKRVLLLAGLLSLAAFTATALASPAQIAPIPTPPPLPTPPVPPPVQPVLSVGDSFVVPDAKIGCEVTRRGSSVVVECRRAGKVKGTYGAFMSSKTVRVAKFLSSKSAQVVFTAKHGGKWKACGVKTSVARASAARCR
jgi:hypothetical protein